MHEMSIAAGIVDIALDVAKREGGHRIRTIQLEVGQLSGVEPEALQFCFEAVTRGTLAERAELVVTMLPIRAVCIDCDCDFSITNFIFRCPQCDSALIDIQQGRELRVASVTLDDTA